MKRIFTLLLAVASLTVVSCQKEQEAKTNDKPEKGLVKVTVLAHSPEVKGDTKTSLADNGSLYWSYGDHICVWDETACRDFESDIQQEAEPTKVTTFSGEIQSGATNFKAVYPYSDGVTYSEGKFITAIPATQYAVEGSFANQANVAVANGATDVLAQDEYAVAEFTFDNVGALVKFHISQGGVHKGVTIKVFTNGGEKIYAKIAGEIQVNPATAEATTTENSVDAVSVRAQSGYLAEGDYYAVILPINAKYLSFTFTDGYSTKTRSTKSDVSIGRSTYYDMGTIDGGITYPDPFVGEWVITGIDTYQEQTYKHVLSKFESGSYYPAADAVSIENGVVTVSGAKTDYKVSIAKVDEGTYAGMYTIKDGGDKYLTAYSTGNNLKGVASGNLEAGSYWDISEENGLYTIVASRYNETNAKNHLRVNHNVGNNPRFSCYASTSTQPKVTLYPYADVIAYTSNPVISCTNNTISITCDTPAATIYYEIGTDEEHTSNPTTASSVYNGDNKPTITANSYVKAYAIAAGYEPSSIVGQAVEYVAPGSETYYVKVTATPSDWSGDYLLVWGTNAYYGISGSDFSVNAAVNIENNQIESTGHDSHKITIEKDNSGYYIKLPSGNYLFNSSNSGRDPQEGENKTQAYTFSVSSGVVTITGGSSKILQKNGSYYRFYADNSNYTKPMLFKLQDNTTWDLKSIAVTTAPTKTTYEAGETFDPTGMVVTATYEDHDGVKADKTEPVALANLTLSPDTETALTTDDEAITITYEGKSTTQPITVTAPITWDLKSIAVTTAPTKTTYTEGEYFNPAGLVVTATFENHDNTAQTKEETVDNADLTFTPSTSTALTTGNNSVTISYTVSGITKTTSQAITVNASGGDTPTLQYTLDGTITATGNAYATASTVTQSGIGWKVVGNTEQNPWRIGGKSITNQDRAIYSTTAISANITQINVTSGATASSLTVNSLTISVHNSASDAENGTNEIASKTVTSGIASSTVTFDKGDNTSWAGKYYRIVYNVTRTSNSGNGYITFESATFYGIN